MLLLWSSIASAASLTLIGDAPFRAPDGISDAALADDGRVVVLSPRGEIARFDAKGNLLGTFQACPDRLPRIEFTVSARHDRLGLSCGPTYRLWELPSGAPGPVLAIDVTHGALSHDGRRLALLGERFVGDATEDRSYLFEIDARTGTILKAWPGEWDRVFPFPGGWVVARGDDDGTELLLEGFVQRPAKPTVRWSLEVPADRLRGGGWTPESAVAVRGSLVCVTHDGGGTCYDARRGAPAGRWTEADRPFVAPGPGQSVRSPNRQHVLEVRRTLLHPPGSRDVWIAPRDVELGPRVVIVTDVNGTVWEQRGEERRIVASTTGDPALSLDGSALWLPAGPNSSVLDLRGGALRALPPFEAAVFAPDGLLGVRRHTLYRVDPTGEVEKRGPLPRLYAVTAMGWDPAGLLLRHGVADWFVQLDPGGRPVAEGPHIDHSSEDIGWSSGRVVHSRTHGGREIGPVGGPYRKLDVGLEDILRVVPGSGWALAPYDGAELILLDAEGGRRGVVPLPVRVADVWVGRERIAVGLRDGRVALVPLPEDP